jgi:hypothetical protein
MMLHLVQNGETDIIFMQAQGASLAVFPQFVLSCPCAFGTFYGM